MAQPAIYEDTPTVKAKGYRRSNTSPAEPKPPIQPEASPIDPGDFEADYTEDRSVPLLAERRRRSLANNTRSFVDMDLP